MKLESLDIETLWDSNNTAKLYALAFSSNEKINYISGEMEDKMLEYFIINSSNTCIYYVHNLSFESFVFINILNKLKINYEIFMNKGKVYQMFIYFNNKKIKLRCSYRLTLLPLKELSTMTNLEKLPFPYGILKTKKIKKIMKISENDFNSHNDYLLFIKKNGHIINTYNIIKEYCINDVEITKKSLINFWKTLNEMGVVNNGKLLTSSSISIHNFFTKYKTTMVLKKIPKKIDDLIRPHYLGGRVENFGNLKEGEIALHFDHKGMYAQVMCDFLPCGNINTTEILPKIPLSKPGFYIIKIRQNMNYPILPLKRDKLYFLNGTFWGCWWFEEIKIFLDHGGEILEWGNLIYSDYYEKELKGYIEENNKIRELGGLFNLTGKNNNNGFFGRMGLNPNSSIEIISNKEIKNYKLSKVINNTNVYEMGRKGASNNVFLSAAITAKARVKLYKSFYDVWNSGGRLLYCDTDSIIAAYKKNGYKNILNKQMSEIMFDENKRDTIIVDAVFALPKSYALKTIHGEEIIKIKGFNTKSSFNKFKYYYYNNKTLTLENKSFLKKNLCITLENKPKNITLTKFSKRIFTPDKKTSSPLHISDIDY